MAMHEEPLPRLDRWALLGETAGLFAAVFAAVASGLLLARYTGSVVSIWTPNGIVVGALLCVDRRKWPAYLSVAYLAYAAGRFVAYGSQASDIPVAGLALGLVNGVEIYIVASAIRHTFPHITEDAQFLALGRVALAATVVACVMSALLAAGIQYAAVDASFWDAATRWFRSHLLGMVIVATLTLVVLLQRGRMLGDPGQRLQMLRDVAILVAVTVAVFAQSRYPLLFVVFAPLLFMVFQHRFPGLVIGTAVVALLTSVATAMGKGPFNLVQAASPSERALLAQVYLGVLCVVAVPVALALADRRRLSRQVSESENRYRLLADYASDLVMRIARDGTRRYVSPSVKDLLGWEISDFMVPRPELIHPDDRERVTAAVEELWATGKSSLTQYRLRHRSGDYLWIEALVKMAPNPDRPAEQELIYTGRDITESVLAEQARADSERRLRTITDNVPAVIAHIGADERYTFINGYVRAVAGMDPATMLGRTVEDVRGPEVYQLLKPHIERALRGETTIFEYEADFGGEHHYLQTTYLPATSTSGEQNGIYALTTEITRIKLAEQQLAYLAHNDVLTGIANRRYFSDGIERAVQHASIAQEPLLVMLIDVDRFKQINDSHGHGAGDAVLREVAARLKGCIRKTDLLARLGGDEFVILCDDIDAIEVADLLAQKITAAMEPPIAIGAASLRVTLSIGMALCRDIGSADLLMQRGDEALYHAKACGRACYRLTTSGF